MLNKLTRRSLKKIIRRFFALTKNDDQLKIYKKNKERDSTSVDNILKHRIVFLVTPGRSGTKALIEHLRDNSGFCALHSPTPWLASIGFKYWQGCIDQASACWAYYACREKYIRFAYERNMVFVDGDCKNLPILLGLAKFLPQSKFIHVVRNPVKFICSGLDRGYFKDKNPEFWGHLFKDSDIEHPIESLKEISFLDQVTLIADFWQLANEIADQIHQVVGDNRFTLIKSEVMFNDSQAINDGFNEIGLTDFLNARCGKMKIINENEDKNEYDIELIETIVKARCPSAKKLYPDTVS